MPFKLSPANDGAPIFKLSPDLRLKIFKTLDSFATVNDFSATCQQLHAVHEVNKKSIIKAQKENIINAFTQHYKTTKVPYDLPEKRWDLRFEGKSELLVDVMASMPYPANRSAIKSWSFWGGAASREYPIIEWGLPDFFAELYMMDGKPKLEHDRSSDEKNIVAIAGRLATNDPSCFVHMDIWYAKIWATDPMEPRNKMSTSLSNFFAFQQNDNVRHGWVASSGYHEPEVDPYAYSESDTSSSE